jgi:hypothetical protein
VTASRINEDGTRIDLSKLDSELKNNAKIPSENIAKSGHNDTLPWVITEKDYMYLITEYGRVVEIKGIALDKSQLKLLKNESKTLRVIKSKDVNGDVTWSSENAAVAIVDQNGKVTAVGEVGDTTKITAKVEGTDYSATCDVTIVNNIVEVTPEEIATNPNKYYGKVVKNYTAGGAIYRIFYVDKENKYGDGKYTVYLKADYKGVNNINLNTVYNNYTIKSKVKEMNPNWAENRRTATWNINEKAAAWLCDPETGNNIERPWSEYYESGKANYVIGGPSAEMYVDSYNSVSHTIGNNILRAKYRETDVPGYVYTVNESQGTISKEYYITESGILDYQDYGSMYCGMNGQMGSYYWWIASPSSYTTYIVCATGGNAATLSCSHYSTAHGVCPLVSLKSDFKVQIEL